MSANDRKATLNLWNSVAMDWVVQVGDNGDNNRRKDSEPILCRFLGDVNLPNLTHGERYSLMIFLRVLVVASIVFMLQCSGRSSTIITEVPHVVDVKLGYYTSRESDYLLGKVKKVVLTHPSQAADTLVRAYDSIGNLSLDETRKRNGTVNGLYYVYEYNQNMDIVSVASSNSLGNSLGTVHYTYNQAGNRNEDAFGNAILYQEVGDSIIAASSSDTSIFDLGGNLVALKRRLAGQLSVTRYALNGMCIYDWVMDSVSGANCISQYTIDSGIVISKLSSGSNCGNPTEVYGDIVLDTIGNWTYRMTTYLYGDTSMHISPNTESRSIEYY